ncbi:MAG: branched-chain amino acid ABC transporter permease [Sulfolobales archaeon]
MFSTSNLKYLIPFLVVLYSLPLIPQPPYIMHVIVVTMLWAYLATAWSILGCFAGQLSLGHAAFFGIGAYSSYFLTTWYNVPPILSLVVGGSLASAISIGIGYPCFRYGLRGVYFTLATIAFAEILKDIFIYLRDITGGSLGVWLPMAQEGIVNLYFINKEPYYYIITTMWLSLILILSVARRFKDYLIAIREDEDVAASVGINVTKYKLVALLISSYFTGLGGAFYLYYFRYINPYITFGLDTSLQMVLLSIFGGMYSLWGPFIGSVILTPIGEYLRIVLGGAYVGSHLVIYGVLLIIVIRFLPKGVVGTLKLVYDKFVVRAGGYAVKRSESF